MTLSHPLLAINNTPSHTDRSAKELSNGRIWTGGRVVYCNRLKSGRTWKGAAGSNPALILEARSGRFDR